MSPDAQAGGNSCAKETLKRPGVHALVRCQNFRCLAYCDKEGAWRDPKDGKELPEVLEVLEEISDY